GNAPYLRLLLTAPTKESPGLISPFRHDNYTHMNPLSPPQSPCLSSVLSSATVHEIAKAAEITLTFEGLLDQEAVANFYDGGIGGDLSGPGPDYGVVFTSIFLPRAMSARLENRTGNDVSCGGVTLEAAARR